MNISNVVYMLNLFNEPAMWSDKGIFAEVETVIDKLSQDVITLSDRELYLTKELTQGLLTATRKAFNKADEFQKDDLIPSIKEILEFQYFLSIDSKAH